MSWHLPGVPDDVAAELARQMRRPVGTVQLGGTYPGLHDADRADSVLAQVITGAHVFRVRRAGAGRALIAEHSSPGTGTRAAEMDLQQFAPADDLVLFLVWSPEEMRFHVGSRSKGGAPQESSGAPTQYDIWVDASGGIVEVGAPGVEVMNATVYVGGEELVSPPARRVWSETKLACETILSGASSPANKALFEGVAANASLSMLVTGLEVYSRKRFSELEAEGITPDYEALIHAFGTAEEREALRSGLTPAVLQPVPGASPLSAVSDRINFQSYDRAKRAWNRGYGLRFGVDLGLSSPNLERVQRLLAYRHRVIHVSPLIGFLNQPNVPPEEPEFSGLAFAQSAIEQIGSFVDSLHQATLRLEPPANAAPIA